MVPLFLETPRCCFFGFSMDFSGCYRFCLAYWSLGQAQISKLEADLTNALEVAKVAEAAATNATAMVAKQVASCRWPVAFAELI